VNFQGILSTKAWLLPGLGFLILCQCRDSSPEKPAEPVSQVQQELRQSPNSPQINAIPQSQVQIHVKPSPLPLKQGGLRFQLDQNRTSEKVSYFKPIGDAKFGPADNLYITFPSKHAVVRFNLPDFDLEFFGQEQAGGRNEPIAHPDTLDFWGDQVLVTNTQKGQVMVFNPQFEMETMHQIHIQDPIPGPDQKYLIRSDKRPEVFFRANQENKVEHYYMVPKDKRLPNEDLILHYAIQPNWDVVAATTGATDLYHIRPDGTFKRHFTLDFSPIFTNSHPKVGDVQLDGDAYWLLLTDTAAKPTSYLFAITFDGTTRFAWSLPFQCDGFHLGLARVVIFNRQEGKAQVFYR